MHREIRSVDEEIAAGKLCIGSQVDAQLPESSLIARSRQMGDVHLASRQFPELAQRQFRGRIAVRAHAQSDQGLVQIQTHAAAPEDVLFQQTDGINHARCDQLKFIRQFRHHLDRIQNAARCGVHQRGIRSGDNGPVGKFQSGAAEETVVSLSFRLRGAERSGSRRLHHLPIRILQAQVVHQDLDAVDRFAFGAAERVFALIPEVAADDLLFRRLPDNLVIGNRESDTVHAHVGRGFIALFRLHDPFADAAHDGENFNIPVVIHRHFMVVLQMEGIHHVDVTDIGGGGLIGDVDRMIQRKIPDRKGFKLCISGGNAALVFVIDLRKTGRHFPLLGPGPVTITIGLSLSMYSFAP